MRNPIDIGASPQLLAKVEEAFHRLDVIGEEIAAEVQEEIGPVGALMIVLSGHGAAIVNIFTNLAHAVNVEWDAKDRKEFGQALQVLLQAQNRKLVDQSTGDSN